MSKPGQPRTRTGLLARLAPFLRGLIREELIAHDAVVRTMIHEENQRITRIMGASAPSADPLAPLGEVLNRLDGIERKLDRLRDMSARAAAPTPQVPAPELVELTARLEDLRANLHPDQQPELSDLRVRLPDLEARLEMLARAGPAAPAPDYRDELDEIAARLERLEARMVQLWNSATRDAQQERSSLLTTMSLHVANVEAALDGMVSEARAGAGAASESSDSSDINTTLSELRTQMAALTRGLSPAMTVTPKNRL